MKSQQLENIIIPQEMFEVIECGDLELSQPIDRAILLLGQTQVGKTTCAHHFIHSILQGIKDDDGNIVYEVKQAESTAKRAKIGNNHKSETRIPNIFKNHLYPQVHLIDCPGYYSYQGCSWEITSNYFYFRLMSRIKQVKLLLVIQYSDFYGVLFNLRNTFKAFYDSFKDFQSKSKDIFAATCFMVTKVPPQKQSQDIAQKLRDVNPWTRGKMKKVFEQFKNSILSEYAPGKNKLFIFKSAKQGKYSDVYNTDLIEINRASKFWQYEMSDINAPTINILIIREEDEDFYEELSEIGKFLKQKIKRKLQIYWQILEQFKMSTFEFKREEGAQKDHYLQKLDSYCKEQILIHEKRKQSRYWEYEGKRKQAREHLFQQILQNCKSRNLDIEVPLWIKKIRIFENYQEQYLQFQRYDYGQVEKMSKIVIGLIKNIAELKKDSLLDSDSQLVKFAYDIITELNISNAFYQMFYQKQGWVRYSIFQFLNVYYPDFLRDYISNSLSETVLQSKVRFLNQNNVLKQPFFSNKRQSQSIYNFIQNVISQIQLSKYHYDLARILKDNNEDDNENNYENKISQFLNQLTKIMNSLKENSQQQTMQSNQ